MDHLQIGEQIGKLLDMPKRPQAQNTHFLGLEYEQSGKLVPNFEEFRKYQKDVYGKSEENGCDTFPNELMRFRFEATLIWETIQKLCENAVIF